MPSIKVFSSSWLLSVCFSTLVNSVGHIVLSQMSHWTWCPDIVDDHHRRWRCTHFYWRKQGWHSDLLMLNFPPQNGHRCSCCIPFCCSCRCCSNSSFSMLLSWWFWMNSLFPIILAMLLSMVLLNLFWLSVLLFHFIPQRLLPKTLLLTILSVKFWLNSSSRCRTQYWSLIFSMSIILLSNLVVHNVVLHILMQTSSWTHFVFDVLVVIVFFIIVLFMMTLFCFCHCSSCCQVVIQQLVVLSLSLYIYIFVANSVDKLFIVLSLLL